MKLTDLSAREREIIKLIADGQKSKEIAQTLGLSVRTVESHRMSAGRKLGARTPAHLVAIVLKGEEP